MTDQPARPAQAGIQAARRGALLAPAAALLLAGCGFKLRQAPDFAFQSIVIGAGSSSPLGNELRRSLAAGGKVEVVVDPQKMVGADVVLFLPQEQREKVVVGVNASGQVREFQLRLRVRFRVATPKGKQLIEETELLQTRDISFNESAVLAKEAEEGLLYRDMQADIVQQLMRRLAALKSL
ncbi:LPS assembly lipoprotein LptE [Ramlibacter sp.]|uniref:LPS-assembly lipoprotein LptE n=1 Tax=Ramlibacter sp. TaxID=1917967 RepID=UPI0035B45B6B